MKRFALALVATLGLAVPAFAAVAPKDPMDELSGDAKSPQRHLIPPGAHEPFIEDSDGSITLSNETGRIRILLSLTP